MSLAYLGKFLPYFLAVKVIKGYNDEGSAILKFEHLGKVTELQGKVRRFDNGEWLFIEDVSELLQEKISLQNKLRQIESRLEGYKNVSS